MTDETPLIICEKTGVWATALRWQSARPLPIVESRSVLDVRTELQKFPSAVVAMEVTSANAESVLSLVAELHRTVTQSRTIVFLAREVFALRDFFQEAGAWVVVSPRRLDRLARYVERHLANVDRPTLPAREAIWSRLPWSPRGK